MRSPPGPTTLSISESRTRPISGSPNPRSQSPKAISGASGSNSLSSQVAPLLTRDNVRLHPEIWRLLMGIRERQRLNNPTLDSLLDEAFPQTPGDAG